MWRCGFICGDCKRFGNGSIQSDSEGAVQRRRRRVSVHCFDVEAAFSEVVCQFFDGSDVHLALFISVIVNVLIFMNLIALGCRGVVLQFADGAMDFTGELNA